VKRIRPECTPCRDVAHPRTAPAALGVRAHRPHPEAVRPEAGITPRHLVVRARHVSRRRSHRPAFPCVVPVRFPPHAALPSRRRQAPLSPTLPGYKSGCRARPCVGHSCPASHSMPPPPTMDTTTASFPLQATGRPFVHTLATMTFHRSLQCGPGASQWSVDDRSLVMSD
jgi:hypothetical protein